MFLRLRNIFRFVFRPRHSLPSLTSDVENVLLPPGPLWTRIFLWFLGSASVSLVIWSIFTRVDEVVLLSGSLLPGQLGVRILPPANGVVSFIGVTPFQSVKKGQVLFKLDTADSSAHLVSLKARLIELERSHSSFLEFHKNSLRSLNSELAFHRDLYSRYKILTELGTISQVQLLTQGNQVTQVQSRVAQSLHDFTDKTSAFSSQRSNLISEISIASRANANLTIHSPLAGILQTLNVQTPGVLVSSGTVLAEIVPSTSLIAELNVPSLHRDSLKIGTPVTVDIDAFSAREFGLLNAKVYSISPTTVEGSNPSVAKSYIAKLRILEPQRKDRLRLSNLLPGMSVTARVSTRSKPVISTVFEFFSKFFSPIVESR